MSEHRSFVFRYCRDPVFLLSAAAWLINRRLEELSLSPRLLQWYLNDFVCLPFFLPPMLLILRRMGLRSHDGRPTSVEVLLPVFIWAIVFEVFLPLMPTFHGKANSDPLDVVAYFAGGATALFGWQCLYGNALQSTEAENCPTEHSRTTDVSTTPRVSSAIRDG